MVSNRRAVGALKKKYISAGKQNGPKMKVCFILTFAAEPKNKVVIIGEMKFGLHSFQRDAV